MSSSMRNDPVSRADTPIDLSSPEVSREAPANRAQGIARAIFAATLFALGVWTLWGFLPALAWAAIIAIPTAITGFFGQNVKFPGEGAWSGLAASLVLIVVTSALLYRSFRRRDWL